MNYYIIDPPITLHCREFFQLFSELKWCTLHFHKPLTTYHFQTASNFIDIAENSSKKMTWLNALWGLSGNAGSQLIANTLFRGSGWCFFPDDYDSVRCCCGGITGRTQRGKRGNEPNPQLCIWTRGVKWVHWSHFHAFKVGICFENNIPLLATNYNSPINHKHFSSLFHIIWAQLSHRCPITC